MLGQKLSEYHTGLRAYSSSLIEGLAFERNSDDFVFDNQIIAQAVVAGARIGEVSCPTRYQEDASSINLRRSIKYGLGVLRTSVQYRLHKSGLRRYHYLEPRSRRAPGSGSARRCRGRSRIRSRSQSRPSQPAPRSRADERPRPHLNPRRAAGSHPVLACPPAWPDPCLPCGRAVRWQRAGPGRNRQAQPPAQDPAAAGRRTAEQPDQVLHQPPRAVHAQDARRPATAGWRQRRWCGRGPGRGGVSVSRVR